jgi:hypothetical protein
MHSRPSQPVTVPSLARAAELLAAVQAERKARLDAGRVDTVFQVGDQVLLRTKELRLLDAAESL